MRYSCSGKIESENSWKFPNDINSLLENLKVIMRFEYVNFQHPKKNLEHNKYYKIWRHYKATILAL